MGFTSYVDSKTFFGVFWDLYIGSKRKALCGILCDGEVVLCTSYWHRYVYDLVSLFFHEPLILGFFMIWVFHKHLYMLLFYSCFYHS